MPAAESLRRAWPGAALVTLAALALACTPQPVVSPLAEADLAFASGDLAAAAAGYQQCLVDDLAGDATDRVLFHLGLLLLSPGGPAPDPDRGRELLTALVERFPASPYHGPAEHVLTLDRQTEEVRSLEQQLERLQADLRRRQQTLEELEKTLEELKRIDLGGRPPPSGRR